VNDTRRVTLEGGDLRLEPFTPFHADALSATASDGRLCELWYTSVPSPEETARVDPSRG
jgi:hypothetical protein